MKKRTGKDIWKNLFEFPLIETASAISIEELLAMPELSRYIIPDQSTIEGIENWKIHLLTHQKINYRVIKVRLIHGNEMPDEFIRVNKKDIFNFAVPKLLEIHLKNLQSD